MSESPQIYRPQAWIPWIFPMGHVVDGVEVRAVARFHDAYAYGVQLEQPYPGAFKEGRYVMYLARRKHNECVRGGLLTAKGRERVLETVEELFREERARREQHAALMALAKQVLHGETHRLKALPHGREARALRKTWWAEYSKGTMSKDQREHRINHLTRRVQERRDILMVLVPQLITEVFAVLWVTLNVESAEALLEEALALEEA
jgi:hypothetical protein